MVRLERCRRGEGGGGVGSVGLEEEERAYTTRGRV